MCVYSVVIDPYSPSNEVQDELKRYLEALLAKSKNVNRMIEQISSPYNPKPSTASEELLESASGSRNCYCNLQYVNHVYVHSQLPALNFPRLRFAAELQAIATSVDAAYNGVATLSSKMEMEALDIGGVQRLGVAVRNLKRDRSLKGPGQAEDGVR